MFSHKRWHTLVGVCLVILTVAMGVRLSSTPAAAQLGNNAVPVRCVPDTADEVIPDAGAAYFRCVAADGTPFGGGQSVPVGYFLMVTDVVMTPDRLTTVDTAHELRLRDIAANNDVIAEFRLEVFRSESLSVNYTTPFFILGSGNRLSGEHFSLDSFGLRVYISGLLVTNVTYVPGVMGN